MLYDYRCCLILTKNDDDNCRFKYTIFPQYVFDFRQILSNEKSASEVNRGRFPVSIYLLTSEIYEKIATTRSGNDFEINFSQIQTQLNETIAMYEKTAKRINESRFPFKTKNKPMRFARY